MDEAHDAKYSWTLIIQPSHRFDFIQSMAIFPCVLPSTRHFGYYQDATAMQWNIHLRSSGWSPIQGFLQWKSWYILGVLSFLFSWNPTFRDSIRLPFHHSLRGIRVHTQRPPGNLCEGFLVQGHQGEWYRPGVHGVLPEHQRCLASHLARSRTWRNSLCTRE